MKFRKEDGSLNVSTTLSPNPRGGAVAPEPEDDGTHGVVFAIAKDSGTGTVYFYVVPHCADLEDVELWIPVRGLGIST